MLRKIAIIGANGFVGRHLVEAVCHQGTEVVGVVRSHSGAAVVRSQGGNPLLLADLDRGAMEALVPALVNSDALVYTASVSATGRVADRTDPAGLANVLAACREAGVPKIVFFSGLGVAHYGMNRHCTNPYFLAKLAGEVTLFRSDLAITAFRPSYIVGAGDEFLTSLIARIAADSFIEIPGDGQYRLQPVSIRDTVRAVLSAIDRSLTWPSVVDLVGPEILSYRALIERIAATMGRPIRIHERAVEEAVALAQATGYFGLRAHDLDCLLCDEVSDSSAVEVLVGGRLESLSSMIETTISALRPAKPEA